VAGSTQLGKRTAGGESLDGANASKRQKAAPAATGSCLFNVSEKLKETRRLPKKTPQRNHIPSPAMSQNTWQESMQPD
jgi:hypothetical protein